MTLSDNISTISNALASIRQAIINKGSTPSGNITTYAAAILNIPSGGITPSGTYYITENGTYNVTNYASANVNVQGGGGGQTGGIMYDGDILYISASYLRDRLGLLNSNINDVQLQINNLSGQPIPSGSYFIEVQNIDMYSAGTYKLALGKQEGVQLKFVICSPQQAEQQGFGAMATFNVDGFQGVLEITGGTVDSPQSGWQETMQYYDPFS